MGPLLRRFPPRGSTGELRDDVLQYLSSFISHAVAAEWREEDPASSSDLKLFIVEGESARTTQHIAHLPPIGVGVDGNIASGQHSLQFAQPQKTGAG